MSTYLIFFLVTTLFIFIVWMQTRREFYWLAKIMEERNREMEERNIAYDYEKELTASKIFFLRVRFYFFSCIIPLLFWIILVVGWKENAETFEKNANFNNFIVLNGNKHLLKEDSFSTIVLGDEIVGIIRNGKLEIPKE